MVLFTFAEFFRSAKNDSSNLMLVFFSVEFDRMTIKKKNNTTPSKCVVLIHYKHPINLAYDMHSYLGVRRNSS